MKITSTKTLSAIGLTIGMLFCTTLDAHQNEAVFLKVLGVAQDAGFPQAGCYQERCLPAWENANLRKPATSLAVVDRNNKQTFLFEATPSLPSQMYQLNLVAPIDEYQLKGVFLTHAHIGHYTGLMYFGHEAQGRKNVPVYAMPRMQQFLKTNGPWSQLVEYKNIELFGMAHNKPVTFPGLKVTPFLVPHRDEFSETVGYFIQGPNKRAVFIPDIDKWEKWDQQLEELIKSVDYALLDATFYADGELPNRDMSKVPHPLVTDTMQKLAKLDDTQRNKVWFIHFNHTNPLLIEGSDAVKQVEAAGFNVAKEGVELPL
jgi:pyrroloquinoline quinone biosynthesis protein B